MKIIILLLLTVWFSFQSKLFAQDTLDVTSNKPFQFNANFTGDFVGNFKGGIKRGAAYLGQVNLSVTLNTLNASLWKGGEFYLQLQNSHGQTPSSDLIGDNQVFTNIENGNFTYLYEFRYKHTFNRFWLDIGIIDLNTEFIVTEEGLNFINSSFGVIPTISGNVPLSIFPKNALGLMVNYTYTDAISVQAAVIDGNPGNLDDDPYNLKHRISQDEGLYFAGELIYTSALGKYKICGYFHSGSFFDVTDSEILYRNNFGFYSILETTLLQLNKSNLNGFLQLGYAPSNRNLIESYIGGGLNLHSPFSRQDDVFGFAFAYANLNRIFFKKNSSITKRYELAIEFNYSLQINKYLTVQPNFQYIVNPGMDISKSNAFLGTLRLGFNL